MLVVDLMLFCCLFPLVFYPSICFIFETALFSYARHICQFWTSEISSPVHQAFIHTTLDFLLLVTYNCMLINQDWVFDLICFPFSELSYWITWSLTYAKIEKKLLGKQDSPTFVSGAWWWGWLPYVEVSKLTSKLLVIINHTLAIISITQLVD